MQVATKRETKCSSGKSASGRSDISLCGHMPTVLLPTPVLAISTRT